jgi:hypothetical protein
MTTKTFQLRKRVFKIIYRLKKIADFSRIIVRITEAPKDEKILASARMNDFIIWIPKSSINDEEEKLYWLVAHEVLHTVKGIKHSDTCLLMHPQYQNITKKQINNIFESYMKE